MKAFLSLPFLFMAFQIPGQPVIHNMPPKETPDTVTIITKFDINNATKDGYYIDGYIVNIDPTQAKEYHGRSIKISGIVTLVRGVANEPVLYDKDGNILAMQGRSEESRHILQPVITMVE